MVTRWAGWEQGHPGMPVSSPESSGLSGLSASQLTGRVGQLPGQRNGCFDRVSGHSSFWGDDGVTPRSPVPTPVSTSLPIPPAACQGLWFPPVPCSGPAVWLQAHDSGFCRRQGGGLTSGVSTSTALEEVLLPPGGKMPRIYPRNSTL